MDPVRACAGVRPKPRLAWNIQGLGVEGTDFVLEGPSSEEWRFRDYDHCQSVSCCHNYD